MRVIPITIKAVVCAVTVLALPCPRAETETPLDSGQRAWTVLLQEATAKPTFEISVFSVTGRRDEPTFCRIPKTSPPTPAASALGAELIAFAGQFGGQNTKTIARRFVYTAPEGRAQLLSTVATASKPLFVGFEAKPSAGATGDFEVAVELRLLGEARSAPQAVHIAAGQTLYTTLRPRRRGPECVIVAATLFQPADAETQRTAAAAQTRQFLANPANGDASPTPIREGWRPSHAPLSGRVELTFLTIINEAGKTRWTQLVSATPDTDRSVIEAALYEEHTRTYRPAMRNGRPTVAYGVRGVVLTPGRWIIGAPNASAGGRVTAPASGGPRHP